MNIEIIDYSDVVIRGISRKPTLRWVNKKIHVARNQEDQRGLFLVLVTGWIFSEKWRKL